MAAFCRFWRVTPRDVDAMDPEEYDALVRYMVREVKETERAARAARRGR